MSRRLIQHSKDYLKILLTSTIGIGILKMISTIFLSVMLTLHSTKIKANLKKVQGQIKLIERMIDNNRYCVEIAQQVNAAIGILKTINNSIIESHIHTCAAKKMNSENMEERDKFAQELIQVFNITNK